MKAFTLAIYFCFFWVAGCLADVEDVDVKSLLVEMKKMAEKIDKLEAEQLEFKGKHTRSDDILQPIVSQLSQKVTEMDADLQSAKNTISQLQASSHTAQNQAIGSAYVRWGHDLCPSSAELVYSGSIGGSWYSSKGGGSNYLCLTKDPVFDGQTEPYYGSAELGGAEYETCHESSCNESPVCAVCRTPRATNIMHPGTNRCPSDWTKEYDGYLMTNEERNAHSAEFICVDSARRFLSGTSSNEDGALLYYTIAACGPISSLPCPPYRHARIVLCAVCSK